MKLMRFLGFTLVLLLVATGMLLYKSPIPADVVDARYTSPSSQFLLMENGARIHYRDEGNRLGEAIVLVHGSNASLHTWQSWVDILASEFRVITLDLPGHGLTGGVPDNDYTTEANMKALDAVVNLLELTEFVLGGNSMGGQVSWRYTLAHPNKVKALILVDAGGLPEWWTESQNAETGDDDEKPIVFKLLAQPWFRAIATRLDTYYLIKWAVEAAYNYSPVVTDELIMRYYELALRKGTRKATMTRYANLAEDSNETYDLAQITQPTLIIWGEEDSFIAIDMAYKFKEALPNAELVTFSDVGHVPMEEIPDLSASSVVKFMTEHVILSDTIQEQ